METIEEAKAKKEKIKKVNQKVFHIADEITKRYGFHVYFGIRTFNDELVTIVSISGTDWQRYLLLTRENMLKDDPLILILDKSESGKYIDNADLENISDEITWNDLIRTDDISILLALEYDVIKRS